MFSLPFCTDLSLSRAITLTDYCQARPESCALSAPPSAEEANLPAGLLNVDEFPKDGAHDFHYAEGISFGFGTERAKRYAVKRIKNRERDSYVEVSFGVGLCRGMGRVGLAGVKNSLGQHEPVQPCAL